MTVKTSAEQAYDALANTYLSPAHPSVMYMNIVQEKSIVEIVSNHVSKHLLDVHQYDSSDSYCVLNVGVGGGQHAHQLTRSAGIQWNQLVDFDISQSMLDVAKNTYPQENRVPQVKGDALNLSSYFPPKSFDVVLAALCDHLEDQTTFYEQAWKVLKPNGILLTTYPHKKLFTIIREEIFKIDVSTTVFTTSENSYFLHSHLQDDRSLQKLFHIMGYRDIHTRELRPIGSSTKSIPKSISQAMEIGGSQLPLLALGVGRR